MRTPLLASLLTCLVFGCSTSSPAPDAFVPDGGIDAWRELVDAPDIRADTSTPDAAIVVDAGSDANVDATFGSDVGPACSPEGMYGLDWIPASTNPSDCRTPSEGITVGPDGLDTGGTTPCSGDGCNLSDCQQHAATPAMCTSSIHFDAPCHGLGASQWYDASFTFSAGGRVDVSVTTHRPDGTCAFTATGIRS